MPKSQMIHLSELLLPNRFYNEFENLIKRKLSNLKIQDWHENKNFWFSIAISETAF